MSKYSGIFLSFLLIFLCLWINICRYPRIWTMVNGNGISEQQDNSARKIDTETEETLETKADRSLPTSPEEPDAWVPKPVVITANNAPEVNEEETDSVPLSAQNVSGGKNPAYFQNATLTSPLDDVEPEEETDEAPPEDENQTEEPATEGESVSGDLQIHSSYLAAASPETSPFNSDAPSYDVKERSAYSCAQTNARSVEKAY